MKVATIVILVAFLILCFGFIGYCYVKRKERIEENKILHRTESLKPYFDGEDVHNLELDRENM